MQPYDVLVTFAVFGFVVLGVGFVLMVVLLLAWLKVWQDMT